MSRFWATRGAHWARLAGPGGRRSGVHTRVLQRTPDLSTIWARANLLLWNANARRAVLVSRQAAFVVAEVAIRFFHAGTIRAAHVGRVVARGNAVFDSSASGIIERAADSSLCAAHINFGVDAFSVVAARGNLIWTRTVLAFLVAEHTAAVGANHCVASVVALLGEPDAFARSRAGDQSLKLAGRLDAEFGLWDTLVDARHPSVVLTPHRFGEAELSRWGAHAAGVGAITGHPPEIFTLPGCWDAALLDRGGTSTGWARLQPLVEAGVTDLLRGTANRGFLASDHSLLGTGIVNRHTVFRGGGTAACVGTVDLALLQARAVVCIRGTSDVVSCHVRAAIDLVHERTTFLARFRARVVEHTVVQPYAAARIG